MTQNRCGHYETGFHWKTISKKLFFVNYPFSWDFADSANSVSKRALFLVICLVHLIFSISTDSTDMDREPRGILAQGNELYTSHKHLPFIRVFKSLHFFILSRKSLVFSSFFPLLRQARRVSGRFEDKTAEIPKKGVTFTANAFSGLGCKPRESHFFLKNTGGWAFFSHGGFGATRPTWHRVTLVLNKVRPILFPRKYFSFNEYFICILWHNFFQWTYSEYFWNCTQLKPRETQIFHSRVFCGFWAGVKQYFFGGGAVGCLGQGGGGKSAGAKTIRH